MSNVTILDVIQESEPIIIPRYCLDLTHDLISGCLLAVVINRYIRAADNPQARDRFVVRQETGLWLTWTRGEWCADCRITGRQFDQSVKLLETMTRPSGEAIPLIEHGIHMVEGTPVTHLRPLLNNVAICLADYISDGGPSRERGE